MTTAKTKTKSRILEAVHESASDLHRLGFIDKRKMQKYDVLCQEPIWHRYLRRPRPLQ